MEGKAIIRSSSPTSQGQGEEGGCVRGEKSPAISASAGVHHSVHSDGSSGMGVLFLWLLSVALTPDTLGNCLEPLNR